MAGCLSGFGFAKPCRVTDASLISQMKAMEDRNRRLKRMYADLSMRADLRKEALGKKYIGRLNAARWPTLR